MESSSNKDENHSWILNEHIFFIYCPYRCINQSSINKSNCIIFIWFLAPSSLSENSPPPTSREHLILSFPVLENIVINVYYLMVKRWNAFRCNQCYSQYSGRNSLQIFADRGSPRLDRTRPPTSPRSEVNRRRGGAGQMSRWPAWKLLVSRVKPL